MTIPAKFPNLLVALLLITCPYLNADAQAIVAAPESKVENKVYSNRRASLGIVGDTADVIRSVEPGLVLMGGGKDVESAFRWMISRSGGGNVVIIRASGTNAYNTFVFGLGKVSSVETLKIDTRELAEDENVARTIRNAEMLFIAGGDQSVYMRQWKGTKTAEAINYLVNKKGAPVGGTSAGCAILSQLYYSGETGSAVSKKVLENPYDSSVTIYKNDFIRSGSVRNTITDQHYVTRGRQGRHVVFMARIISDWKIFPRGIAADERTAVCIDEKGIARIFGTSKAFFIQSRAGKLPEVCEPGKPLHWVNRKKALKVYEIQGTPEGNGKFDAKRFQSKRAKGGKWSWWWVEEGELKTADL